MHASTSPDFAADFRMWEYRVRKRPHLAEFLQVCFEHFEVAVWTSSSADYAWIAVQNLFPQPELLRFIWARDRCTYCWDEGVQDFVWAKRLQKVKRLGHPLQRILAIDDSPEKFRSNYGNLLPIPPFWGDAQDTVLLQLAAHLPRYRDLPDVRKPEKRGWPR